LHTIIHEQLLLITDYTT